MPSPPALDPALDRVRDVLHVVVPGSGILGWAVEKVTGVDVESDAQDLLLSLTNPLREQALGLIGRMEQVIRSYEGVLEQQREVLRAMAGVVRPDAGPVDRPGDAELRRGAFFRSVYGHDPVTPAERRMAETLDVQGSDVTNTDPNAVYQDRGGQTGDPLLQRPQEELPFGAGRWWASRSRRCRWVSTPASSTTGGPSTTPTRATTPCWTTCCSTRPPAGTTFTSTRCPPSPTRRSTAAAGLSCLAPVVR